MQRILQPSGGIRSPTRKSLRPARRSCGAKTEDASMAASRMRCVALILLAGVAASALSALALHAQTQADRTQDKVAFPAHTIIGNLHYVGTATLNSYLFTT